VLDLFALPVPPKLDGPSLLPLAEGEERGDRIAVAHQFSKLSNPSDSQRSAIRTGRFKAVASRAWARPQSPVIELYDLHADPGERDNLAESRPEIVKRFRGRFRRELGSLADRGLPGLESAKNLPIELRQRLRALGYLE
jgi:arylsulfatase A-like enzyme